MSNVITVSKTGTPAVFHRSLKCRALGRIRLAPFSAVVEGLTRAEAEARGLTPCTRCLGGGAK